MKAYERFLNYIKFETTSDPNSQTTPSNPKELILAKYLVEELETLGLEATLDEYGYVYTKVKGNVANAYKIGFLAHMDTSHDASGKNVNPRIIKNYQGEEIILNDKRKMNPESFDALNYVIGDDLIVTDGNTLLGSDNKAGIAEIMSLLEYLTTNDVKHGDVYVCFTPDEEIGAGVDHFNYDNFKVDFAYTVDGGFSNEFEYENFNAASAKVKITGKSIHPGSAKGKMINASLVGMEFHSLLPEFLNPAFTEGYEGFNHLTEIVGKCEYAELEYIIRNHDKKLFNKQKEDFKRIALYLNEKYGYEIISLEIKDSYYNMKEHILKRPEIIDIAFEAIRKAGLNPVALPIRGGTDGARLTYEGVLTPNIGVGGANFHGVYEFQSINQMNKTVEILKNIVELVKKDIN